MDAAAKVHVHPVVLLSIIDSYEKRSEDSQEVVGTLLGTYEKGIIEVTYSFVIPHKESNTDVSMNLEFGIAMLKLERKMNRNLRPVGWYATGSEVKEYALLIHQDYYMKHVKNPIFLLVDPNLNTNDKLNIQAFQCRSIGVPGGTSGSIFLSLDVNLELSEAEKSAVDMMVSSQDSIGHDVLKPTSGLLYLYKLILHILEMLEDIIPYVEKIITNTPPNSEVLYTIARLLFSMPKLDAENVEDLVSSSLRDLLMLTYVTNLLRSHVKLINLAH